MKETDDFYVGWNDEMSKPQQRFLSSRLTPILLILPVLAFVLVTTQKPFVDHRFELGSLTEITGVYHESPFPILVADSGQLPDGLSRHILLVGYGKFGARGIFSQIRNQQGSLNGKSITLQGTLIYGDGKTLMELTKQEASVITIGSAAAQVVQDTSQVQPISMQGEILDPKCYFGVMKPGEGKIHKSCAIRCISGGIPPVFRTWSSVDNQYHYYILVNGRGEPMNKQILPLVGESIEVQGVTKNRLGWDILYVDPEMVQIQN